MPAAVALESAGFNIARAVGPAAGGLVVSWLGPGANFLINAASFLATIVVLYRWKRAHRTSPLPGERLLSATRAGLRYASHAPELHAVLVRPPRLSSAQVPCGRCIRWWLAATA